MQKKPIALVIPWYGDQIQGGAEKECNYLAHSLTSAGQLFVWQKTYIENEQFRKMGETTARVLRDLLDVSEKPIDYTRGAATPRQQFYRKEIREIKAKLDAAGIPTRTVFFSEKDKRAYMHKKRTGGIDRGI